MFKWFSAGKKTESEEIDTEIIVPEPPPPNIDVALKIRKGKYSPLYYAYPDDLKEEIINNFHVRENRIRKSNIIRQMLQPEIENAYYERIFRLSEKERRMKTLAIELVSEYVARQNRSIDKIHFTSFLKKYIPIQYIKRYQRKQYAIKHRMYMKQIRKEIETAYHHALILKSNRIDHQLLMIALNYEIKTAYSNILDRKLHTLRMFEMQDELIRKAKEMASLKIDKYLYKLYMRMILKDVLFNHRKYLEVFASKEDQRYFMKFVMTELREKRKLIENVDYKNIMDLVLEELKDKRQEIEEVYEDFQEFKYQVSDHNELHNKHLKILYEDNDFMQWGTIDPFIAIPQVQEYGFFQDKVEEIYIEKKNEPINIECDFSEIFKNDFTNEKSEEEKMEEGTLTPPSLKYREGYLELVLGSMFSGKSSRILFKLSCMADQRFSCLYINHTKDDRKTESRDQFVSTHNSSYSKISSKIQCVKVSNLSEVNITGFDYIAIDELQFFDNENTVSTVLYWVKQGKYVLIASLDGDAYRRRFGKVLDLIPHADKVKKLSAYCDMCRDNYGRLKSAPFTARMTSDTTAELVGGADLYKAMCRECHDFHLDVTVRKY